MGAVGGFLFTCHDAGGTVPPVLATAEALVARGHDVTVLSQPSVRDRARAIGCEGRVFPGSRDYRPEVTLEEQLDLTVPMLVGAEVGRALLAVAEDVDADVLVVDPNLAGALAAAEAHDLPSAVLLHSLFRTFVDVWFGELWSLLAEPIDAARRSFGLPAAGSWAALLAAHDVIVSPVPEPFDARVAPAPATLQHVGFLVPSPTGEPPLELPPGDAPLVAVSYSTTCQHQEAIIRDTLQELADEPVRVVATTGGYRPAGPVPSNAVVADHVPHAALFAHADVVVTHGGLGTVAAALRAGVPLVCRPGGRDQPLNAERVVAVGAGTTVPVTAPTGALRAAVSDLLTDLVPRARARDLAASSRRHGETEAAAATLEALLATG